MNIYGAESPGNSISIENLNAFKYIEYKTSNGKSHTFKGFQLLDYGVVACLEFQYWNFALNVNCNFGLQEISKEVSNLTHNSYSFTLSYKF